jgi:CubicO group peptidase (beta-lactamase class C family)
LDYARARLFDPLGITTRPATTITDPDYTGPGFGWARAGRVELGSWGLRLTAPDLAKLGQLYLQDGVWDGTRLLPEDWVTEATTPGPVADQVGLLWWHEYEGGFAARGYEGQRIVVIPDQRAVIVTLCATTLDDFALDEIDYLITRIIRPAIA